MAKKSDTFLYQILAENKASKAIRGVKSEFAGLRTATFETFGSMSFGINIAKELGQALVSLGRLTLIPIQFAMEQEKAERQLAAVLKSTGEAAGVTAEYAKELASGYQELTTFGDEATLGAESLLLTFTKIGADGGIFDRTLGTVLDVSAALDQDLKSSAMQLGKALNDPIQGLSMLRRTGISFSEDQMEVVKQLVETNRLADAQTLILDELETQFGGSAAALRETFGGAVEAVNNQWGDFLEELGFIVTKNPTVLAAISGIEEVLGGMTDSLEEGEDGFGGLREMIDSFISEAIPTLVRGMAIGVDALSGTGGIAVAALKTGKVFIQAASGVSAVVTQMKVAQLTWDQFNHDLRGNGRESAKLTAEIHSVQKAHEEWEVTLETVNEKIKDAETGSSKAGDALRALADDLEGMNKVQEKGAASSIKDVNALGMELEAFSNQALEMGLLINSVMPAPGVSSLAGIYFQASEDLGFEAMEAGVKDLEGMLDKAQAVAKEARQELGDIVPQDAPAPMPSAGLPSGFEQSTPSAQPAEPDKPKDPERDVDGIVDGNSQMMLNGMQDAFASAAAGYQSLADAGKEFTDGLRGHLTSALLDPIFGAQSAFHQITKPIFGMVESIGQAIHDNFIEPIISGIVGFFTKKTALEEASAVASTGIHAAEAVKTLGVVHGTVAAMTPSLAAAATLSLIATFGASGTAAALLPGLLAAAQAQGLAAVALADGAHVTEPTFALIGEAGAETVVPETRPARARDLILDMLQRNPDIMGKPKGSSGGKYGGNTVIANVTVNPAAGQSETEIGYEVARAIDELLGGQS
ncbi:MAG: phage tail tape measure protein [Planctomycetes bacterium]|nr:phage tail tape measure protein [Planctomycetota bacterium]